jgi:hypothetical protein
MPKECPLCKSALKVIPAGTSKASGKPYPAFYACPNKCNLKGVIDTRVEKTPEGWAKPATGDIRKDVGMELLTNIEARTKIMLEILQKLETEMGGEQL